MVQEDFFLTFQLVVTNDSSRSLEAVGGKFDSRTLYLLFYLFKDANHLWNNGF